jgi:16S rRNA (cytosine967-C5)-methyltransferase
MKSHLALNSGAAPRGKPGEAARRIAVSAFDGIVGEGLSLDEALAHAYVSGLEERDRAFAHLLIATSLRRKGQCDALIDRYLARPLPRKSGPARSILITAAAQILFLDIAPHAAIDLAVTLARADRDARHFAGLINAVLRRIASCARPGDDDINMPDWLMRRWVASYGEETARNIARSHLAEAPLDLTAKSDPEHWAHMLGGMLLPTGTIRLPPDHARIETLPGFAEGAWFVQDAAAALPAGLLGDVSGLEVADLCAAPGGKTAQLSARGAQVTAVDRSPPRMDRLKANLARLGLEAKTIIADLFAFETKERFDAVLLDAPCSATGTIRRHPDLPYRKDAAAIGALAKIQSEALDRAALLVKPGGLLVYATCSLEPEEGEAQAAGFLKRQPGFRHDPVGPADIAGQAHFINVDGDLRTHPTMEVGLGKGLDGFFAARFRRG